MTLIVTNTLDYYRKKFYCGGLAFSVRTDGGKVRQLRLDDRLMGRSHVRTLRRKTQTTVAQVVRPCDTKTDHGLT
jgi:hypothetical protein